VAAVPFREAKLRQGVLPHDRKVRSHVISSSDSSPFRQRLLELEQHPHRIDAYELGQLIFTMACSAGAGSVPKDEAWDLILAAARLARRTYDSWRQLGDAYAYGLDGVSDGRATCTATVEALLADPHGPWRTLAWDLQLEPAISTAPSSSTLPVTRSPSPPTEVALPLRQRWCLAIGAPIVVPGGGDPTQLGGIRYDARGAVELVAHATARLHDADAITTRDELIAWTRTLLHDTGERALDLARVVAAIGWGVRADLMTEEDGWHVILVAGKLAQAAYRSWAEYAEGYTRAWRATGPVEPTATQIGELRAGLWSTLPWDTDLEVTLFEPGSRARVLRVVCSRCGAPRLRPSPTAFVYCDHCGGLVDYDLARACERPLERPGPVYEALHAELAPELAGSRDDLDRHRALQRRLFEAWVDACPTSVPIRMRDPEYRARYVAWHAEAETIAAFDAEARDREAAMRAATATLGFAAIDGRTRVLPGPYRAMCEAAFAYEARRDELFQTHGIYARHPDGASRELARRIGNSMFVQGWLPFLDEADARALVERTGLAREYVVLDAPETHATECATCGGALQLVTGARRVVCDHCGRQVDVIG